MSVSSLLKNLFLASLIDASYLAAESPPPPASVFVGVGTSQSLEVRGLTSATVANGKVARVRAVPPSRLVVTGVRPGVTTLRAWNEQGTETAYSIEVAATDLWQATQSLGKGVARVAIEFVEIDSNVSRNLGIRWPEALRFSGAGSLVGDMRMSGLNYNGGFETAQGFVSHLVKEGWAKILAKPELYVRFGEQAKFHSGGEFPVTTTTQNFGQAQQHVQWKKFGMSVTVRPRSLDKIAIQSDVALEISEPNAAASFNGIPSLIRREIDTKINSDDGETVILSGLVRETASQQEEGLPILKDIPLLGPLLFAQQSQKREETELLMALTVSFATQNDSRKTTKRTRERYEALEE